MATLKISDLSVGDWVRFRGLDYQVKGIDGTFERVTLIGNKEQRDESIYALHPIPISAEILEKNGWESSSSYWSIYKDNGDYIEIWRDGDKWYLSVNSVEYTLCDLRWVHQIQHLMRVWGFDKEINL